MSCRWERRCKVVSALVCSIMAKKRLTSLSTRPSALRATDRISFSHQVALVRVRLARPLRRTFKLRLWTRLSLRSQNLRSSAECYHHHIMPVIVARTTSAQICSSKPKSMAALTSTSSKSLCNNRPLIRLSSSGKWSLARPTMCCCKSKTTWTTLTHFSRLLWPQILSFLNRIEQPHKSGARTWNSGASRGAERVRTLQACKRT